mgnify:CR=1 FL=1
MIRLDDLVFKKLDYKGLQTLVLWAETEGWNPGPHDAEVYWAADPDGYYGYFYQDILIGGGSIVSFGGEFGFMGFFIVRPEYRSLGIGRKLWYQRRNMLISRLTIGASIGMDGVIAMQDFYSKGGFEIAFRDERHEKIGESFSISNNVTGIEEADIEEILIYDSINFGFSRPQFIIPSLNILD